MIQIFGTKKSADARKAERFFKERGVKYQYVDLKEKGLSRGELLRVAAAVGGVDNLIDPESREKDLLSLLAYLVPEQKLEKLLENQSVLKQPIVLFNVNGFYDDLVKLIADGREKGFIRPAVESLFGCSADADEVIRLTEAGETDTSGASIFG